MAKIQQNLTPKQIQELSLKPKMLQSLQVLALPLIEMETKIRQELELNPILELEDDEEKEELTAEEKQNETTEDSSEEQEDLASENLKEIEELSDILDSWNELNKMGKGSVSGNEEKNPLDFYTDESLRDSDSKGKSIFMSQLEKLPLTDPELQFAKELVDSIDDFGYLPPEIDLYALGAEYLLEEALEELKKDNLAGDEQSIESYLHQKITKVHEKTLGINPKGITARTVPECLLAQLPKNNPEYGLISRVLFEFFDDLIHCRHKKIASKLRISLNKVYHLKDHIALLNPKPGLYFLSNHAESVIPDVIIKKIADEYEVIVNDSNLPTLTISPKYRLMLQSRSVKDRETLNFIRDKINSAKFVIKSIYMRHRTIHRVTKSIISHQKGFFYKNTGILEPLTYSIIAADLGICESTVSRVVKNKYVDTPFGVFCLKEFFTSTAGKTADYEDVSRQNVERHIRRMIDEEEKKNPVSDLEIANKLKELNINVSRRVIAKYREGMGILNSRLRRSKNEQ